MILQAWLASALIRRYSPEYIFTKINGMQNKVRLCPGTSYDGETMSMRFSVRSEVLAGSRVGDPTYTMALTPLQ